MPEPSIRLFMVGGFSLVDSGASPFSVFVARAGPSQWSQKTWSDVTLVLQSRGNSLRIKERRGTESNRRMGLLQSPALPLGYPAAEKRVATNRRLVEG